MAKLLVDAADPFSSLEKAFRDCGLPQGASSAVMERMKRRYGPVKKEVERLTQEVLIGRLEEKLDMTLDYYDDAVVSQAAARDLVVSAGILIDKIRLIKGEPTAIVGHEERKEMDELIEAVVVDAKRRGITIDVSSTGQHTIIKDGGGNSGSPGNEIT